MATPTKGSYPRPRPRRDWVAIIVTALPGIAALIAVFFTYRSIQANSIQLKQTRQQLRITEQGQFTGRYNAAVENLGSQSEEIQLGGIYALQRLMQDSARDQPTIIAVLAAFVREKAPVHKGGSQFKRGVHPTIVVQAALNIIGTRNTKNDGSGSKINLENTQLNGASFRGVNFSGADFSGADLTGSFLAQADFSHASLVGTNLSRAKLRHVNLTGANLRSADLIGATLGLAELDFANLVDAHLEGADLYDAELFTANMRHANLTNADLRETFLEYADLQFAILIHADMREADTAHAQLRHANLTGAKGVRSRHVHRRQA